MCAVCAMCSSSVTQQFHLIFHSYIHKHIAGKDSKLRVTLVTASEPISFGRRRFLVWLDPLRLLYGQITFLNYCFTFNRIFCSLLQSKSVFLLLILYGIRCFTLLLLDVFNVETCSHGHRFLAMCIRIRFIPFHSIYMARTQFSMPLNDYRILRMNERTDV